MDKDNIHLGWRLAVRVISLLFIIVALVLFLQKISWVIGLMIIATLLVYSLSPLTTYLTQKGIPHYLSVSFVYVCLLLSVILFFYAFIPTLITELVSLTSYLATDYRNFMPSFIRQIDELLASDSLKQTLQNLAQNLPATLQTFATNLTAVTSAIFSRLTEVFIVLFLVYYLLRDINSVKSGIIRLFPTPWQKEATLVFEIIDCKVGAYLRGNIIRCIIVGVLTGVALKIVGMPFALMLGILAGLLNLIVYVGPYLAAIPAVLLALAPNSPHPLLILLIYVIGQALDGLVLTPLLLGKAVDLMPISIITSLLVGGQLFGFLGIFLAIPIAATLKVVIYHYYYGEDCNLNVRPSIFTSTSFSKGYQAARTKLHAFEKIPLRLVLLDILSGLGFLLLLSPLFFYWLIHGSYERYLWLINGPFPFNNFGGGPFQLFLYLSFFLCGLIILGLSLLLKNQTKKTNYKR